MSARLVLVKMVIGEHIVNVISAYAPQHGRSDVEKEEFCDSLMTMVSNIPRHEGIVVAGDLNGHVGIKADGYEGVHGGFNHGLRNDDDKGS